LLKTRERNLISLSTLTNLEPVTPNSLRSMKRKKIDTLELASRMPPSLYWSWYDGLAGPEFEDGGL